MGSDAITGETPVGFRKVGSLKEAIKLISQKDGNKVVRILTMWH